MEGDPVMPEDVTSSISGLPLSASGQPPLIVTLAPKSAATERTLTDEEVELLQVAMMTRSVTEMATAIRSIKPLSFEIRKQNSQALHIGKNKPIKKHQMSKDVPGEAQDAPAPRQPIKKRAPRSQTAERRRPWKPERLDPSKPILQCDACGYQANRRDYMRRHQIRVHSDYRPYQCTLCDFKTTEKHDLDRHMNSKYHGGKGMGQKRQKLTAIVKIKCDQCSYSTKSVNSILKHKQSHMLARSQQAYEEQLEEDDGGEPMPDDGGDIHEASLTHAVDGTDGLDDSDAVAVLMMNDLMAQAQSAGD